LFIFSTCQGIGSLVQGLSLRLFDRKKIRSFSMLITALATFLSFEINGLCSTTYTRLLGLSEFSTTIQILIILGAKHLLVATTVIAKETIAEVLKLETLNKKYNIE
jgi:hypothetical protein